MAKRKYVKKSDYWKKFEKNLSIPVDQNPDFQPDILGEAFYTSDASYSKVSKARTNSTASNGASRINRSAVQSTIDKFSSIRRGMLPYKYSEDGVDVRDAIELCQKAYVNVAIFRNAVDIMAEFANSEIYLKGGTKKSREFFTEFFKRINLTNLKDQFFREYYRSGNIFIYRFDGKFKPQDYIKVINQVGIISPSQNKIPTKYVLLNPYDISAKPASTFNTGMYEKVLSNYEILRFKNPQTEDDKEIYDSFDPELKKEIQKNSYQSNGVKLKLDPNRLSSSFYKKQDYEPFAVPFGYAVLEDINTKLEFKKMDQAITRTVENVILLITMGSEPDKGGVNANNINAMQQLFRNESVGRVLVSDYTTKADFVIPDLNKVLGPDKYQILNEDIKQGLQNIVVGEEKYSSTQVKAQIFIDRLKEARQTFISDFLQKEIKRISKELGFKGYPEVCMKDIDMRDETQLMRVATRLMELGIITPQQGMDMFHTGKFPEAEDISPSQKEFIDKRKDGFYNPIVGGIPMISPPDMGNENNTPRVAGRPEGSVGIPKTETNGPQSEASFSRKNIQAAMYKIQSFGNIIEERLLEKFNIKELSESQQDMAQQLCETIVCAKEESQWNQTFEACIDDSSSIEDLYTMPDILSVGSKHNLEDYPSAILYHSSKI